MADHQSPQIAADPETDSALGEPLEQSTLTSLRSSILEYQHENGRTYHSMSAGKYTFPNDDQESERLDLQHQMWLITFEGELALNPGHKKAKRVLDIGTGTGMWAIDYADAFPAAEVIGVDLSPIQPAWAPPNCTFEIDDLEKEWTWTKPFDFILCRGMSGCFSDVPALIKKSYQALAPGGWFETGDLALPMCCDDGTVPKDSAVWKWHEALYEASKKLGKPIESLSKNIAAFEEAGFVDIGHKKFIWPFNTWPHDKKLKEIGRWQCVNLDMGLEAFSLALLTRVMGWTKEEVLACCAEVRKDIRNRKLHGYWTLHVVYARKPEAVLPASAGVATD